MGKLFKAVFYVTLFSVLTRALGFLLRIYLSRVLGAELLGSYQVAMSVFSVLLTLIASGLPTVIGRTVANLQSKGNISTSHRYVTSGLIFALSISILASAFILLFPQLLNLIFTSPNSTNIVLLLLPGLVSSSIYTILRGALWGEKHFFTISFAEFFEQLIRIFILIILVALPLKLGLDERAALSLSIACVISMLFVIIMYLAFGGKLGNPKTTLIPLIKKSSPITAVRTISNIVTSAISLIIPIRLMLYGLSSSEALAEYGIIMGMSFPLLMVPSTLIGSISVAMVPEISEQTTNIDVEVKNHTTLSNQIVFSIGITLIISFILFPAFLVLGPQIGTFLYANTKSGLYLSYASFLMIPLGLSQITGSILNAIGLELKSLKNSAISALLLFLSIYFLPKYIGIWALILGMALLSVTQSALNLLMLSKRKLLNAKVFKILVSLSLISLPTIIITKLISKLCFKILPMFFALSVSGLIAVLIFAMLTYIFNIANVQTFIYKKRKKLVKNV